MEDIIRKISYIIIALFLFGLFFNILKFILPVLVVLAIVYTVYVVFFKKEEPKEVKWYEGSETDSYYQKEKVREEKDVIDVEVKVRKQEDDTLS